MVTHQASFTGKLTALRRSIKRWVLCDGLVRVLGCLAAIIALDFGIDWLFQLDRPQRIIMLALMAAALVWAVFRWLLKPLSGSISDEAILHEVQQRSPEASRGLLSAFELAKADRRDLENASAGLVTEAVRQGNLAGEQAAFTRVLRRGRFALNSLFLLLLLALLAAGGVAARKTVLGAVYVNRNLLLGDRGWPQDFELAIDGVKQDGILAIPRGDEWPLTARILPGHKRLPEEMKVEFRLADGRRRETMNGRPGGEVFVHLLEEVREPFEFRLLSGRVRTLWFEAVLRDRPVVEDFRLVVTPPAYTGRPEETLPAGAASYQFLKGSAVRIEGKASKELSRATLSIDGAAADFEVAGKTWKLSLGPEEAVPGDWTVEIVDRERLFQPGREAPAGLAGREPLSFSVRHAPDRQPRVKMTLYGIGNLILPSARIPYRAEVDDDVRVSEVRLHWWWKGEQEEGDGPAGSVVPQPTEGRIGEDSLTFDQALEAAEVGVVEGARLRLRLEATDNDNVDGPNVGQSSENLFRVVDETQFRNSLLAREKQQQQLFETVIKRQDDLLTECEAFLAENRALETPPAGLGSAAAKLHRRQKQIGSALKPILEQLQGILDEIRNNRLPDEGETLQRRLAEQIVAPLRDLHERGIPTAALQLDHARSVLDAMGDRNQALESVIATQNQILEQMRAILFHMVKNARFQIAVIKLYEIKRLQEELSRETDEEKEKALRELLESSGAEPPKPAEPPQ